MRKLLPLALAAVLAGGSEARSGPAPDPQATVVVTSFRAVVRTAEGVDAIAWQAPERFAVRPVRGTSLFGRLSERGTINVYRYGTESSASVLRRTIPAGPDGGSSFERLRSASDFVLAEARAGKRILVPARLGARPAYRARVFLHANDCAALRSGQLELWLDRRTLLPLRADERRRGFRRRTDITYSNVNRPPPASAFAPPPVGQRPYRDDGRFVRTTPSAAARRLPYAPLVPAAVPDGFRLAVAGWAPLSGITGAEGSNPRYRSLFAAVYRRGAERVDVTQRLAGPRGWLGDPFGQECGFQVEEPVSVDGARATFGAGPGITPHLYWRRGPLLLTVSGPFPRRELVAIARSLEPV